MPNNRINQADSISRIGSSLYPLPKISSTVIDYDIAREALRIRLSYNEEQVFEQRTLGLYEIVIGDEIPTDFRFFEFVNVNGDGEDSTGLLLACNVPNYSSAIGVNKENLKRLKAGNPIDVEYVFRDDVHTINYDFLYAMFNHWENYIKQML